MLVGSESGVMMKVVGTVVSRVAIAFTADQQCAGVMCALLAVNVCRCALWCSLLFAAVARKDDDQVGERDGIYGT